MWSVDYIFHTDSWLPSLYSLCCSSKQWHNSNLFSHSFCCLMILPIIINRGPPGCNLKLKPGKCELFFITPTPIDILSNKLNVSFITWWCAAIKSQLVRWLFKITWLHLMKVLLWRHVCTPCMFNDHKTSKQCFKFIVCVRIRTCWRRFSLQNYRVS